MSGEGIVVGQGRSVQELAELIAPGRPPTAEQAEIIGAGTGPMLVVAGAGSGKTETLSMRIVYLLDHARELLGEDISPDQILCLTFTRKAAAEIAERAEERIGRVWDAPVEGPDGRLRRRRDPERPAPTVATYNAYAAALAAEHGLRVGVDPESAVVTDAALWQLSARSLEEWTETLDVESAPGTVRSSLPRLASQLREHGVSPARLRTWLAETLASLQALPKKAGEQVPGAMTQKLAGRIAKLRTLLAMTDLVEDFQDRKRRSAVVDFSDQVATAVELSELPAVQEIERSRYRAILLDEFQDTSPAQLRLFAQIFGAAHPVMAVGDPNQAIYGFRGASAAALEDFVVRFGGPEQVRTASLSVSWRNEGAVLDAANAVAAPLRASSAVEVRTLESRSALLGVPEPHRDSPAVAAHMAATAEDEISAMVDHIVDRREELGHGRPYRGADGHVVVDPGGRPRPRVIEAAVLCRRRATIPLVVDELERRGIDYEVVGLGGLLDTADVADLVALLEVAHDPSRGDALMRLLTSERVNLGPRDLMALKDRASAMSGARDQREAEASIVDALEELPPSGWTSSAGRSLTDAARERLDVLRGVVRSVREHAYLPLTELVAFAERAWCLDIEADVARPDGRVRRNVDAFLDATRTFAQGADRATLGAFLAWLDAARSEERGLDAPVKAPEPGAIQILTVHSSKGLEWDVVAIPGATDGRFPMFLHFHGKHEDGAWLTGDPELPWPLRMDQRSLPEWHVHAAVDHASLDRTLDDFRVDAGQHRLDEERRLFYVALTRARSHVLVSGSWYAGGKTVHQPSPFVRELVEQGLVSDSDWAPEPEADGPPPEPPVHTAPWPRPASPVTVERRALARAVQESAPASALPWADQIDAMLAEHAQRAPGTLELSLPSHLSTSALVSLRRDRGAFALQLRRPVPQEPTVAAQRGSALHAWIETQYGHVPLLQPEDLEPDDSDAALELSHLKETFAASEWASREPTDIEVDVEVPVAGLTVRSRIDAVFPPGGGLDRVTVVDWKSGRPPRDPDERAAREVQLAVYRLAWSEWKGMALDQVDAAFYYVAADVTVRPEHLLGRDQIVELVRGEGP